MARSVKRREDERAKLAHRIETVSGIVRALDQWSEVSRIVASSTDREDAHRRLVAAPLEFTSEQALFVLDLSVARLTAGARSAMAVELDNLLAQLDALT